jgi:hypothetical protein
MSPCDGSFSEGDISAAECHPLRIHMKPQVCRKRGAVDPRLARQAGEFSR